MAVAALAYFTVKDTGSSNVDVIELGAVHYSDVIMRAIASQRTGVSGQSVYLQPFVQV